MHSYNYLVVEMYNLLPKNEIVSDKYCKHTTFIEGQRCYSIIFECKFSMGINIYKAF